MQKTKNLKMKAILFSIGTRGDIEPFLAIAQLLNEKNWDVICVFPEQFREEVEDMGLLFEGFSKEYLELMDAKEARSFMSGEGSFFTRIGYLIKIIRNGKRLERDILNLQHETQKREKPDRVLYHPKCNYSLLWGMVNPGKSILVSPIPGVAHPIKHLTILGNYGKALNLLSVWLGNVMKATMLKFYSKRYHQDYQKLKLSVSTIKKSMLKKEKTFYAVSNSLFQKPKYWPSAAHVIGYFEREKTQNWQPDIELTNFLAKHKKIVFITFGSMTNLNPKEKTRIIINVLIKNKIPAIINISGGGLEQPIVSPEHIHFVENIPYDWIFSRMYAIVHHGGSGTTHSALKYSCPNLIIPHILDQFFWNNLNSNLNLGPKGIPIKKLSEINFENKLLALMNNDSYKINAQMIGEKMSIESNKDKLYDLILN